MIRARLRDTHGFTLIEVMVAALVLVIAFTALGVVFLNGQSQASADLQQTQLTDIADQEMEQVRAAVNDLGFSALGMSTAPTQLSATTVRSTFFDPDSFVVPGASVSCFLIASNYDSVTTSATTSTPKYGISPPSGFVQWNSCKATSTSSTDAEPVQTLTNPGSPNPNPIVTWSAPSSSAPMPQCSTGTGGGLTVPCWVPMTSSCSPSPASVSAVPSCAATVYAFVTDTFVGCGTSGGVSCPSTDASGILQCPSTSLPTSTAAETACADARRVIIAVVPNQPSAASRPLTRVTPVYLSTIFTNPDPSGSSSSSAGLTLNLSI